MPFNPATAILDKPLDEVKGFNPATANFSNPMPADDAPKAEWKAYYKQAAADKPQKPLKDLVDTLGGATPDELSSRGNWIAGGSMQTLKDVASIPLNALNQLGFNYPRSIIRTMGYDLPFEAKSGVAQTANKIAGVAGMIKSPIIQSAITAARGGSVVNAALQGATQGAVYAPTDNVFDLKERVINAAGGAVAGAATEKILAPLLRPTAEKLSAEQVKRTNVYRDILRPTQGEVNKIEMKSGKNISDFYDLAQKEGLVIGKTADNKLDTSKAIEQLQGRKDELFTQLDSALSSDTAKRFNLEELRSRAKASLVKTFKTASEIEGGQKHIDDIIDAELRAHPGETSITGQELNKLKQGLWSMSYSALAPNNNKVARQIGFVAKDMIEQGYPDRAIKDTNDRLGKYLTLEKLLTNAQGRVVKGGRLGGYVGRLMGGMIGSSVPVPVLGTLGGAHVGGVVADIINNPERITKGMAKGIKVLDTATPTNRILDVIQGKRNMLSGLINMPSLSPKNVVPAVAIGGGIASQMLGIDASAAENIDMNKIYKIESSNNPNAVNKDSGAKWLGQITPIVLKEWNNFHSKEKYNDNALFNAETNKKIADWYMNKSIPKMLKAKGHPDTVENRLIAYNWGIGNVGKRLPKETSDYIKKYKKGK